MAARKLTPAELIREARTARGLSQERLAVSAGLSSTVVRDAEQQNRITWKSAKLLAPILGVNPHDLLPLD